MSTRFCLRPYNKQACEALTQAGILRPIAQALSARQVFGPDDLRQDWRSLLAPSLLKGTDRAAALLADAIQSQTPITVVADYDCDGATACAVALRGLALLGLHASYVVPDRFTLGYGLTPDVVDLVAVRHPATKLIVTVDNGIASVRGVERARELGIQVLITDHHLAGAVLPAAACIVNPNANDCAFQSKALAGCGVMFYVLLAVRAEMRRRGVFTTATQPRLDTLADLVSLGTIADVVRLDRNNRILIAQGLDRVRQNRACAGIRALFEVAQRNCQTATVRDFGFAIAPRINAAGRLTEMGIGIECLLTDDMERARQLAAELDRLNQERKGLESAMQLEAAERLETMDVDSHTTVTLFDESWHIGVVGLVAGRVRERIHRPVIAFARDDNGQLKGSGRSIEGVHLRDALDRVSKMDPSVIVRFGGHAMAAGLTIQYDSLARFRTLFEKAVSDSVDPEVFNPVVYTDGALSPEEISFPLVEALSQRIWGQGFEIPLFANDFTVLSQRISKNTHTRLILDLSGARFEAVYFRHTQTLPTHVRLAYRPEINEFNGRRTVQLVIVAAEM